MIRHIRCTLYTHGTALLTAGGIFLVFGLEFRNNAADLSQISIICDALNETFRLSPMLLLPVAVLAVALACRLSAIYALTLSSISAILLAVFLQGFSTADVLTALYQGVSMKTGNALVNEIYSRGGITSMTTNITSLLCSLMLGGALSRTGVMVRIAASLISITRTRLGLILASFAASFIITFCTGIPMIAA